MANFEFDKILTKVGECGRYQIKLYIFLGLLGLPTGWQNLAMVFIGGQQDHWCAVPEQSHLPPYVQRNMSTPIDSDNLNERRCMYYDFNYTGIDNDTGPAYILNRNTTDLRKCNSWFYDTTQYKSTIRSQWDLVCDNEYMVSLATSIYMTGFLTGAVTLGSISDIIGRKKALLAAIIIEILSALASAIASRYGHYAAFVILRFIVGNSVGGSFTVAFVIVMEIIGPRYRMYMGVVFQCWFAIGFLSVCGIAFFIRDHFHLQLALALPVVALLSYYWLIPESPRWLYAENRSLEAEPVIRTIAKYNNRPFPAELEEPSGRGCCNVVPHERATLLDILRRPRMRMRLFIVSFIWFVTSLVYYGLSYNADSLGGSVYVNASISSAVEIPACVAMCFLLDRFGRRWMLVVTLAGAGVALLAIIPVLQNPGLQPLVIVLANVGKFGSAASFAIIYVFTAELFPTVVRNVAVGSGSMCARVGGLLAPQLVRLDRLVWFALPAVLMGGLSLIAGFLALTLPETSGQRLPETLDDGEKFGSKAYKRAFKQEYMEVQSKTSESPSQADTGRME